ncbi:MAG: TlyA family RNA methyltransferase [Deltaproteobacteria bacterium]|nr:TlyA family RNA methyltransferase [Deltaproteobacteria bacterium]
MKKRLDQMLVEKGLAENLSLAAAYIMEGKVRVKGIRVDKPGHQVQQTDQLTLELPSVSYVSRGGLKLDGALRTLGIDVKSKVAMDVGSSTGGFTDCLLQHGAEKVFAIDVGYGLLDYKLRQDKRVVLMEGINFRHFEPKDVMTTIDIATIDVSFISLELILPNVFLCLKSPGHALALIKPQFELEQRDVERGGIVRSAEKQAKAVSKIEEAAKKIGFHVITVVPSDIKGTKGNQEFFLYLQKP